MTEQSGSDRVSNDYLETLEKVKQQYQQYVEVSRLYELPTGPGRREAAETAAAEPGNPLTTDRLCLKPKTSYAMNREI